MNTLNQKSLSLILCALGAFCPKATAQTCTGSGSLNVTVQECSGVSGPTKAAVRIYPNPTTAGFWVKNPGKAFILEVFDVLGQKIWTENIGAETEVKIEPATPLKGIYWIRWGTGFARESFILIAGIRPE